MNLCGKRNVVDSEMELLLQPIFSKIDEIDARSIPANVFGS